MTKLADELTKRLISKLTSEPEKLPQSPEAVTWDTPGVGSMDIQEFADALKAALTEAMQAVRRRDAEIAGREFQTYKDIKDAHERLCKEPFKPSAFNLRMEAIRHSEYCAAAIERDELP